MKLLVEDAVFDYQPGRGSNKSEFTDLYLCEIKSIVAGGPLDLYQRKAHGNWNLRLSFDGGLPATEVGEESDIDAVEKAYLFHNSERDDDSDNNE